MHNAARSEGAPSGAVCKRLPCLLLTGTSTDHAAYRSEYGAPTMPLALFDRTFPTTAPPTLHITRALTP